MIDYEAEYDNSARVADADTLIETYAIDAALFREREDLVADFAVPYDSGERTKMDIFWPDDSRDAPLTMFIHGGYWRSLDCSSFSHLASGLLEHGIAVAVPSYDLCPETTIKGIVAQMRRACLLLNRAHRKPITVFGHSAGGHLAACMMATDWPALHPSLPADLVQSGMGISGLYDLAPLLHTPINEALRLDANDAAAMSPRDWLPPALHRFDAWVGGTESDEYHRQSRELANSWSMSGTPSLYVTVANANHFTIVDELTNPESPMVQRLVELVSTPTDSATVVDPDEAAVLAAMQPLGRQPADESEPAADEEQPVEDAAAEGERGDDVG